jgi:hypothetical protein
MSMRWPNVNAAPTLEQCIEAALASKELYSGELTVLIAAATATQERLRILLPQLITRLAAVIAEEKEAAACSRNRVLHLSWQNEPEPNLKRS